jgi:uncharacterized repeat protein (TIGR02543 family)
MKKAAALFMAAALAVTSSNYSALGTVKAEEITLTVSEYGGYEEGAYIEWEPVSCDGYRVYVSSDSGSNWTQIDDELIREYPNYYRADILGLKEGSCDIWVQAVNQDSTSDDGYKIIADFIQDNIEVTSHDRSGFAHFKGTASGAYNEDGSLKENANVIYITEATKDTVTLEVKTGSNSTENCVGLQKIFEAYSKGEETKPLAVRFIGNVTDLSNMINGDIRVKNGGLGKNSEAAGITVEGVGEDAVLNGFGIRINGSSNVEIRNLGFMNCDSEEGDNIGVGDGSSLNNDHIWVHNCDFFYGEHGSDDDQKKGDGMLDCKLSDYVTFSYNHFWDSGKSSLLGFKNDKDVTTENATYHHNWFDHSDSRHPRVRYYNAHVYNNYYDGIAKYGIGAVLGSSIFADRNYFKNCKKPMLIAGQGSDDSNGSTFSNEAGGMIKAYGNYMDDYSKKYYIPYAVSDSTELPPDETGSSGEAVEAETEVTETETTETETTETETTETETTETETTETETTETTETETTETTETDTTEEIQKIQETEEKVVKEESIDRSVEFDAYEVSDPNDIVPNTVMANQNPKMTFEVGEKGSKYNNFDTESDFYEYKCQDAEDVPDVVMAHAGRVNQGDFSWEFDDSSNTRDYNSSDLNEGLKAALESYTGSVVSVGGIAKASVEPDNSEYNVTFDPNNGEESEIVKVVKNKTVDELPAPTTVPSGKTSFGGWFNGYLKWDFNTPITEDITLKAYWLAEGETVTDGFIGKTIGIDTGTVTHVFSEKYDKENGDTSKCLESDYFSFVGEIDKQGLSSAKSGTYDNATYGSPRLAMKSSTEIKFRTSTKSKIVLFMNNGSTKTTKIDGTDKAAVSGIIEVDDVKAGLHTINGKGSDYLYAIMVIPNGEVEDEPEVPTENPENMSWTANDMEAKDYTEDITLNGFTIKATSSKKVTVDNSSKTVNGKPYTKRLKTNGSGESGFRSIMFTTKSAATLEIHCISGSSTADRNISVATLGTDRSSLTNYTGTVKIDGEEKDCSDGKILVSKSAPNYIVIELKEAATYCIYPTDASVSFYGIYVTYPIDDNGGGNGNGGTDDNNGGSGNGGDDNNGGGSGGTDNNNGGGSGNGGTDDNNGGGSGNNNNNGGSGNDNNNGGGSGNDNNNGGSGNDNNNGGSGNNNNTGDNNTVTEKFTVTFNTDGGTAVASQTVDKGAKATKPADAENPTKEGYTFAGWYKDAECTIAFDFDTEVITADTTVYAKWDKVAADEPTPGEEEKPVNTEGLKITFADGTDKHEEDYTGSAVTPSVIVKNNGETLIAETDYTVKYSNNINASNSATVTITGKGQFAGTKTLTFTIRQKDLADSDVEAGTAYIESGKTVSPVIVYGGQTLKANKDYTFSGASKAFTSDDTIEVQGKGNFKGTKKIDVKIVAKTDIKKFDVTLGSQKLTFNGEEQKAAVKVTDKTSRKELPESAYSVSYSNATNAGTVKVTVVGNGYAEGLGYYTGTVTKTYKIDPVKAQSFEITGLKSSGYEYMGTPVTLSSDLKIACTVSTGKKITLTEGEDYKLSYSNNSKIGSAKCKVTFLGNYKGSKVNPVSFTIKAASLTDSSTNVKVITADKVFNKAGIYKSAPYVKVGKALVKSSEYTVTYYLTDENGAKTVEMRGSNKVTKAGTKIIVEVKGKPSGNYSGLIATGEYTVRGKGSAVDISKAKLSFTDTKGNAIKAAEYTGNAIDEKTVLVKVMVDGRDVSANCNVSYINNVNTGKATVVVNGNGTDCVGSKTGTFKISAKNIKNVNK